MADLGALWTVDGAALSYARSKFLCDVRAAGALPAIDGVCMHVDDYGVLASECAIARTLGFDGKVAIHPHQLPVIRQHFEPSEAQVEAAQNLLTALAKATLDGVAVIRHEGRMVDAANARLARRVLERAGPRRRGHRD